MWSWIPALVSALLAVAKGLFGLDRPTQVITDEKPSPLPPPAPADVLRDLGIASGANGKSGGAFPTDGPVEPFNDRVHYRTNGGGAPRAYPPGPTAQDFGERDSQR